VKKQKPAPQSETHHTSDENDEDNQTEDHSPNYEEPTLAMRSHDNYDKYDDYDDCNDNRLSSQSPMPRAMEERAFVESPTHSSFPADDSLNDFSWEAPSKKSKKGKKKHSAGMNEIE
jgi:hypothetical protein